MIPLLVLQAAATAAQAVGKGVIRATDPYRKYNKQQIKDLKAKIDSGVGLTAEEQDALGRSMMAPARTLIGQDAMEQARLQATTGGQGGGAAAAGLADRTAGALGRAGTAAGQMVGAADFAQQQANKAELESRLANAAAMRNDFLSSESKTVSGGLGGMGQAAGMKAVGAIPGAAANMAKSAAPAAAGAIQQNPAALGRSMFGGAPAAAPAPDYSSIRFAPSPGAVAEQRLAPIVAATSGRGGELAQPTDIAGAMRGSYLPTMDQAIASGDQGTVATLLMQQEPRLTVDQAMAFAARYIAHAGGVVADWGN